MKRKMKGREHEVVGVVVVVVVVVVVGGVDTVLSSVEKPRKCIGGSVKYISIVDSREPRNSLEEI